MELFGKKKEFSVGVEFKVFAIRDEKAQAFMPPFTFQQVGEAERFIMDMAREPQSIVSKHASDYTLYQIGTYCTGTGRLEAVTPLRICSAADFMEVEKKPSP